GRYPTMEKMTRALVASLLGALVVASPSRMSASGQDALARLRAALGGEKALAGVQTLRARGTIAERPFKSSLNGHFDIALALPDRFVSMVRDFEWSDASFEARRNDVSQDRPPEDARRLTRGDTSSYEHVSGFDRGTLIPAPSRWTRTNDPSVQAA